MMANENFEIIIIGNLPSYTFWAFDIGARKKFKSIEMN